LGGLITIATPHTAGAVDGSWIANANANWTDTTRWAGGIIATNIDSTAYFTNDVSFSPQTVTLDANWTVGNLVFSDAGANSFTRALSGANTLTLDVTTGQPVIRIITGTTIGAILGGNDGLLLNVSSGTLTLGGLNTYTGTTTLSNGTVYLGTSVPIAGAGALGNDSSSIILSGGNNNIALQTSAGVTIARDIDVVAGGSGTVTIGSDAAAHTFWTGNISLGKNTRLTGSTASRATFSGILSGAGGVDVTTAAIGGAAGTVVLTGLNTYTGQTRVIDGTLLLTANAPNGAPGSLGNATSAIEMGTAATPAAKPITLKATNGVTVARNINVNNFGATVSIEGENGPAIFSGDVVLNKSVDFNPIGSAVLDFTGTISGVGGIRQAGNSGGVLRMFGTNTYNGTTTVGHGIMRVEGNVLPSTPGPLGNSSSAIILGATGLNTLEFRTDGPYTIARDIVNTISPYSITIGGNTASASTFSGNLSLAANATLDATSSGSVTFSGNISGATKLTVNTGRITLTGNNTYTGGTLLGNGSGITVVGSDTALSTGLITFQNGGMAATNGARTLANAVQVDRSPSFSGNDDLTITGGVTLSSSGIFLTAYNISVAGPGVFSLTGPVSGIATVTKTGSGTLVLAGNSTYTNTMSVSAGTLIVAGNNALGTTHAGTTVASGTTLGFRDNVNYTTTESVSAVGTGVGSLGAIKNVSGHNTFAGPVTFTGNTSLGADADSLTLSGAIGQTAATTITKVGPGTVALTGTLGYTGNTAINGGALRVNASLANLPAATIVQLRGGVLESSGTFGKTLGTAAGNFNWAAGGGGFSAYGGVHTIDVNGNATADNLTWGTTASFVPSGSPLVFGSVTADNAVDFTDNISLGTSGTNTREVRVNNNTNSTADKAIISGLLTGTSGNTLLKSGGGVLEFKSAHSYSGNTIVSNGTLLVNNGTGSATGSGSVSVLADATLSGTGIITGAVTVNNGGALTPGNSPGTLTVGPLTLNGTSILNFELGPHDTFGVGYVGLGSNDLTMVTGNLTLDGILNVTALSGFNTFPAVTNVYRLFDYTGSLTDNTLSLGTMPVGNDYVVDISIAGQVNLMVTALPIPEPYTVLLLALGGLILWRRRYAG
jgi:autotransporter-associated beta strand protein